MMLWLFGKSGATTLDIHVYISVLKHVQKTTSQRHQYKMCIECGIPRTNPSKTSSAFTRRVDSSTCPELVDPPSVARKPPNIHC